jgi:hypothetical protein
MEEFEDGEFSSVKKRILSELEEAGEKGLSYENLTNKLIKNAGAWGMEILLMCESVMIGLENFGYISQIRDNGEIKYRLNKN